MTNLRISGAIVALVCLVLDQVSKWWVLGYVAVPPHRVEVAPFANFVFAWNKGISFGMFHAHSLQGKLILLGLALSLTGFLIYCLWTSINRLQALGMGFALGGAIGNIIDRVRFGAVFDFIDLHVQGHHWYTFNIADAGIVFGVALAVLGQFVKPSMIDWKA